ncbi:MAG: hypothetical protein ACRCZZ_07515, partial [Phocaeicola sp.]
EISKEVSKIVISQSSASNIFSVENKQIIPILDKVTALVNGVINNTLNQIPIAGNLIAPVLIPPALMKFPVLTSTKTAEELQRPISISVAEEKRTRDIETLSLSSIKSSIEESINSVESILKELPSTESKERATTTNTYKVALQSCTPTGYDYSSGDPVSYSLVLPLVDYEKPSFG